MKRGEKDGTCENYDSSGYSCSGRKSLAVLERTGPYNKMEPCFRRLAFPYAENDLRAGGRFFFRMEAKDGSFGFDFSGTYDEVVSHERISYTLDDGRKVQITFQSQNGKTEVIETFEAETTHPAELQKQGWQAILNNFKAYVEQNEYQD